MNLGLRRRPRVGSSTGAPDDRRWGPAVPPLQPGEVMTPGYEVVSHLRRGRRLDTYDVWSVERGCRCVAKTLRPERDTDERSIRQLGREHSLLARLTHPHLVRAYDLVTTLHRPRPVLILETLTGTTVDYLLEAHRRLPLPDVAVLGLQLASALGYLHRSGWVHLDVKPSNVIASESRAVLIDLSVAERIGALDAGGTTAYQSPEQSEGGRVTEGSDVWGLGITLWECATGHLPTRPRPTGSGSDALDGVVVSCLDMDPTRRPTLDALIDVLTPIAGVDPRATGAQTDSSR